MKQNYYTRKEAADYFNISIASLVLFIEQHNLKEVYFSGKKWEWGNKLIRIPQLTITKIETIINK